MFHVVEGYVVIKTVQLSLYINFEKFRELFIFVFPFYLCVIFSYNDALQHVHTWNKIVYKDKIGTVQQWVFMTFQPVHFPDIEQSKLFYDYNGNFSNEKTDEVFFFYQNRGEYQQTNYFGFVSWCIALYWSVCYKT